MNKDDIIKELEIWFESNIDKRDVWNRDELGKWLKNKLNSLGYWRNRKRGKSFTRGNKMANKKIKIDTSKSIAAKFINKEKDSFF